MPNTDRVSIRLCAGNPRIDAAAVGALLRVAMAFQARKSPGGSASANAPVHTDATRLGLMLRPAASQEAPRRDSLLAHPRLSDRQNLHRHRGDRHPVTSRRNISGSQKRTAAIASLAALGAPNELRPFRSNSCRPRAPRRIRPGCPPRRPHLLARRHLGAHPPERLARRPMALALNNACSALNAPSHSPTPWRHTPLTVATARRSGPGLLVRLVV